MLENARVWRHVCATRHDAIGEAYWHGQQDALETLRAERAALLVAIRWLGGEASA